MRVVITITEEMKEFIDQHCEKTHMKQSDLIRLAIHEFAERNGTTLTEQVQAGGDRKTKSPEN